MQRHLTDDVTKLLNVLKVGNNGIAITLGQPHDRGEQFIGFGLFPERLLHLTQLAAGGLDDPSAYMHSVFPERAGAQ